MFNTLLSIYYLCSITIYAFFFLFFLRHAFIRQKKYIFLFHLSLFIALFFGVLVGGSVLNDAYKRFEQFIQLEENNQLQAAKKNSENYDSMFAIDLKAFNRSDEFKGYLQEFDNAVDKAEAIAVAWIFVLLTELCFLLLKLIELIVQRKRL